MNILLVVENDSVRNKTAFALEAALGGTVSPQPNVASALSELLDDKKVDLLICEESNESAKIFKYLVSSGAPTPVLIIQRGGGPKAGDFFHAYPDLHILGQVTTADPIDEIIGIVKLKLGDHLSALEQEERNYVRIKTELLLRVAPLEGDIYIRLSTIKFVKIFRRGDHFDQADLERYFHQKRIEYFYVTREDSPQFVDKFKNVLSELLAQDTVSTEEALAVSVSAMDTIQSLAGAFGFTGEVQELVHSNVQLVTKSIRSNPSLGAFLANLDKLEGGYLHAHSVALGHLCCYLSIKMGWNSDSTFEKLNYASLLHDVTLKTDEQARIRVKSDLGLARPRLSAQDEDLVLKHPVDITEHIRKFSELPQDVDTILMQHHERPDGTGFPRGLPGPRIAPLACVFIMAHDILDAQIFQKLEPKAYIEANKHLYPAGNFKKLADKLLNEPLDAV